jgi:hypothetical protein
MLTRYTRDFIERYRDRPTVLFYELTNEINLGADLDAEQICARTFGKATPRCEPSGNFSTTDLIAFATRFATFIRTIDPTRLISSGFSLPRSTAQALREAPAFQQGGRKVTADTAREFSDYLIDIHQGIDIVSVHYYNAAGNASAPRRNEVLGIEGDDNADLLDLIHAATISAGKQLFIGEFGDWHPFFKDDPSAPFSHKVLEKVMNLGIDYAAIWVWQLYSGFTRTHDVISTSDNIEQGYTDQLIATIIDTNEALGNRVERPPPDETVPPRVVITWPLPDSEIVPSGDLTVYARASDNDYAGGIDRVEFLVDGDAIDSRSEPPYVFPLHPSLLDGRHALTVRAYDGNGNSAEDTLRILDGMTED